MNASSAPGCSPPSLTALHRLAEYRQAICTRRSGATAWISWLCFFDVSYAPTHTARGYPHGGGYFVDVSYTPTQTHTHTYTRRFPNVPSKFAVVCCALREIQRDRSPTRACALATHRLTSTKEDRITPSSGIHSHPTSVKHQLHLISLTCNLVMVLRRCSPPRARRAGWTARSGGTNKSSLFSSLAVPLTASDTLIALTKLVASYGLGERASARSTSPAADVEESSDTCVTVVRWGGARQSPDSCFVFSEMLLRNVALHTGQTKRQNMLTGEDGTTDKQTPALTSPMNVYWR